MDFACEDVPWVVRGLPP